MRDLLVFAIEPCLQEQAGGNHVNLAPHLLFVESLLTQDTLGLLRGQTLILKLERKIELIGDLLRHGGNALGLGAGLSGHGQGTSAYQDVGLIVLDQVAERLGHTGDLGGRENLDGHRHLAVTARDGDADPGLPYVQRERDHSDYLGAERGLSGREGISDAGSILATGLGHVGTAATATVDQARDLLNHVTGMETGLHGVIGAGGE